MKKSFVLENLERFALQDNTSYLTFLNGCMISFGTLNNIKISIDLRYCKGCGICAQECPTGCLDLEDEHGKLREAIHSSYPKIKPNKNEFNPHRLLTWQEIPHRGGLILANEQDSYNLTGYWRVGEVIVANADLCALCGLCYLHCPENIIRIEKLPAHTSFSQL